MPTASTITYPDGVVVTVQPVPGGALYRGTHATGARYELYVPGSEQDAAREARHCRAYVRGAHARGVAHPGDR